MLFILATVLLIVHCEVISEEENAQIRHHCTNKESLKRVLNGNDVDPEDMRYTVMLEIRTSNGSVFSRCSGSLISSRHVLTAAHCFIREDVYRKRNSFKIPADNKGSVELFNLRPTFVHYGGHCVELDGKEACPKDKRATKIQAKQVSIPKRYVKRRFYSGDIAIVELSSALPSDGQWQFACVPSGKMKIQKQLYSAGHGFDPNNRSPSLVWLKKAQFTHDKFCDPSLKSGADMFCTEEQRQFMCKGDSGSGVMQSIGKAEFVLGVLSGGLLCDIVNNYVNDTVQSGEHFQGALNTDTRKYCKWICNITGICPPNIRTGDYQSKTFTLSLP